LYIGIIEMTMEITPDPIQQFKEWFAEARQRSGYDATAMTLATTGGDGRPSARIVLLKQADERGFMFVTNHQSAKAREIKLNAHVALVLHWPATGRQVRVEGKAGHAGTAESDAYWKSRPRGSQLGAWASLQSEEITSMKALEDALQQHTLAFEGKEVSRPPHWGAYLVEPSMIEFWEDRDNRLHERIRYEREKDGWRGFRLAP
jgi:pyridoxamine 5'-phosphate oxidase